MIERAGTCSVLSVFVVILATIVLHRVEPVHGVTTRANLQEKVADSTPPAPAPTASQAPPPPVEKPVVVPPAARGPRHPESPLTLVKDGETFVDVARRIYGDGVDMNAFWKVNRDQLPTPESKIWSGMILRTPVF